MWPLHRVAARYPQAAPAAQPRDARRHFPPGHAAARSYHPPSRQFEFISINADKLSGKDNILKFLQKNEASNKNYIFNSDNNIALVEAIDPKWSGALPYTLLVEQGGNVIYRIQGPINMIEMRKLIVNNRYIDGVK